MKLGLAIISLILPLHAQDLIPRGLRAEYHAAPPALGTTAPRLSWKLIPARAGSRDLVQSAYEIQAAGSAGSFESTPLCSSGEVASAATDQIEWKGSPLASRDLVVWRVRVWDGKDQPSPWSEPASFGIGLLATAS